MKFPFILIACLSFICSGAGQSGPVPLANAPLVPASAAPGSAGFEMTVSAANVTPGATVTWNGTPLPTKFIDSTHLRASVSASFLAKPGTAAVRILNPGSLVTSNVLWFSIVASTPAVAFTGTEFPTLGNPEDIATGDFNADGNVDLAIANWAQTNSLAILMGRGDGTFDTVALYDSGKSSGGVAVGDFSGDGVLDLVTTNDRGNISILLGNGDGTFQSAKQFQSGRSPFGVVVADFNGDGKLDVAEAEEGTFSLFLGNGDGTMQPRIIYRGGGFNLCVGDFNGDGIPDLGFVNLEQLVGISLGNGDGTFQPEVSYLTGSSPYTVTPFDVNGDGVLDLVIGDFSGTSVLLGKGDGTFGAATTYATGLSFVNSATVADFNADGKPDIAVGNTSQNTISVLLGNGDGTFQPTLELFQSGLNVQGMTVGDFNNDGAMDIALSAYNIGRSIGGAYVSLQTNGPAVLFSEASLSFNTQLAGTQSDVSIFITNVGKTDLEISRIGIVGPNKDEFLQTNQCGATLAVNSNCFITVSFVPVNRGLRTASLLVNDNAINHQQSIGLSGIGTWMALSPSALNFGDQKVGTVSPPKKLRLTNVGDTAVTISQIFISPFGNHQFRGSDNCSGVVAGGSSCTIFVQFSPTMKGKSNSVLGVMDTGGGPRQETSLTGKGT